MKITGARSEPFSDIRRRALAQAVAQTPQGAARPDGVAFLGLTEADLTPAVRAALTALLTEIDDLRGEVARLKAHLADAEGLADRDPLTPLLNRRAFLRELARARTFAERYGAPASLVYFDLDGLKAVNDRFGHAAGDAALVAVAERLAVSVRGSDVVARLGGDEFAVLLAQADQATAESKAAALARAVESQPLNFGEWSAPIHISYGVCELKGETGVDDLLAKADAAMYAAKRARKATA